MTQGENIQNIVSEKEVILNKIKTLGKLANLFTNLRKENENKIKIKALVEKEEIPKGVKTEGPIAVKATKEFFNESIKAHQDDEMMPKIENEDNI